MLCKPAAQLGPRACLARRGGVRVDRGDAVEGFVLTQALARLGEERMMVVGSGLQFIYF